MTTPTQKTVWIERLGIFLNLVNKTLFTIVNNTSVSKDLIL